MRTLLLLLAMVFILTGCTTGMMITKRDSSISGRGTVEGLGRKLSIIIDNKSCTGHYASVRDKSEIGLINAYVQSRGVGASAIGTIQSSSTTSYAKGMLSCNDGDLMRCELKHDGPSGYGICVGNDGTVYDIITGNF